jgi:RHH-type proline utilization regulon transcriptional repressor/proline dehydrogenase/delta 1-pyrroline-5-carboxylate dehydrogenase
VNPGGQPVPLVAETGGLNAMVVDTSALPEQVVQDVIGSAFDSAGQRCSALRLLCVQREAAPRIRAMLLGAMQELRVGDPRALATDVGPVIDDDARTGLLRHVDAMRVKGFAVTQPVPAPAQGCFVPPTLVDLPSPLALEREVFGPVLHLVTYERDQLPALLAQVNAAGYGLTGGVHTRIDETVVQVAAGLRAGNLYVNRNMVGAVVGVQPFGGEGLSGTGPKAGGPLYLLRLLSACPPDAARRAVEAAGSDAAAPVRGFDVLAARSGSAPQALAAWAEAQGRAVLATAVREALAASPAGRWRSLPGPTGEANLYAVLPREHVLCLAPDGEAGDAARLQLLAAVLAVGATAVWPADAQALAARLPELVRERILLAQDPWAAGVHLDAVLHAGPAAELPALQQRLAARPGAIVGLTHVPPGAAAPLERLVQERSLSLNTAAAGGNASLMTIG